MSGNSWSFTTRWSVRVYELDSNGHVNNAVYLNWAEQVATQHAEATGFGGAWAAARGGSWVVHRHEITYHRPALFGDEVELTTCARDIRGARGFRRTTISRCADGVLLAEIETEWVWVRLADGRPTRVPEEIAAALSPPSTAAADGGPHGPGGG